MPATVAARREPAGGGRRAVGHPTRATATLDDPRPPDDGPPLRRWRTSHPLDGAVAGSLVLYRLTGLA